MLLKSCFTRARSRSVNAEDERENAWYRDAQNRMFTCTAKEIGKMMRGSRSHWQPYGVAVLAVVLALLLTLLLRSLLEPTVFPLFLAAVMFSAWYGGLGPGLVATVLASLFAAYIFIPPSYSLAVGVSGIIRLGVFWLAALLVSSLSAELRTAKRRAEAIVRSLQESEARYRLLFEANPHPMWVVDLETLAFLAVNQAAIAHYGYSEAEFLRMTIADIRPPEHIPALRQKISTITTGYQNASIWKHRQKDGSIIDVEVIAHTISFAGRRANLVLANDVTARLQAEAELLRAHEGLQKLNHDLEQRVSELHTLLDVIPIGIGIAEDPECKKITVNPSFARQLGISPDRNASLSGTDAANLPFKVYQDGRELCAEELPMQYAAANGVEVSEVELDVVHDDGLVVKLLEYAAPLFDQHGFVRGCVGAFVDITERKHAEKALRESESRFRRLFESNMIGIIFWEISGNITKTNDAFLEMVGYTQEDLLAGRLHWDEMTPPEYRYLDERGLEEIVKTGISPPFEKEYIRKDGSRVPILLGSALFEGSQHNGISFVLDLTERKRLEEALRQQSEELVQANRLKDEFLAIVSHELRSPLNAILGWTQLLRTRKFDEATTARALETIERNARSQTQLIEDLLDISRIIRGKIRLNIRPVELGSVIEAAINTVRLTADAKSIDLRFSILDLGLGDTAENPKSIESDEQPDHQKSKITTQKFLVSGDADRLQQVVWNLLANAIKFTPEGGRVEVRLDCADSYAQIRISDTGKGINPDFLPYVFERFRQEDSTSTRSHSGLGLGLAIARQLVEMHGGTIHAESPGEGQGATFIVKLPLL